jgi:hypothetical protein
VFESLIKAGAFDSLAQGTPLAEVPTTALRPRAVAAIDPACESGARLQADRERGQGGAVRRGAQRNNCAAAATV